VTWNDCSILEFLSMESALRLGLLLHYDSLCEGLQTLERGIGKAHCLVVNYEGW